MKYLPSIVVAIAAAGVIFGADGESKMFGFVIFGFAYLLLPE